jgi:hypothetical protein
MEAIVGESHDAPTTDSVAGGNPLLQDTWAYLVYSFDMVGGASTTVTLYKDNTDVEGTKSMTSVILVDATGYDMYVGVERATSASDWTTPFNGYIYDLHVY